MSSTGEQLIKGQTYFIVVFADGDLSVPVIQTLIFDRKGTRDDGSKYCLFREIPAHAKDSKFLVEENDVDHLVLDQAGLLKRLIDCFDGKLLYS